MTDKDENAVKRRRVMAKRIRVASPKKPLMVGCGQCCHLRLSICSWSNLGRMNLIHKKEVKKMTEGMKVPQRKRHQQKPT